TFGGTGLSVVEAVFQPQPSLRNPALVYKDKRVPVASRALVLQLPYSLLSVDQEGAIANRAGTPVVGAAVGQVVFPIRKLYRLLIAVQDIRHFQVPIAYHVGVPFVVRPVHRFSEAVIMLLGPLLKHVHMPSRGPSPDTPVRVKKDVL